MADEEFLSIEEHRRRIEHRDEESSCPRCGEWVHQSAPVCPFCGVRLTDEKPLELISPSQGDEPLPLRNLGGIAIILGILMAVLLMAMIAMSMW